MWIKLTFRCFPACKCDIPPYSSSEIAQKRLSSNLGHVFLVCILIVLVCPVFGDISCSNVWLLLIIIEQNGSTFVVLILTKNQQKSSAGYFKNSLGSFMGTILTFFWVIHLSKVRLHKCPTTCAKRRDSMMCVSTLSITTLTIKRVI